MLQMSFLRKKYKCCFIGSFGAGKTSFVRSILGLSSRNIQSTLGIDFFTTTICVQNTNACITLWDTAGSERFRSLMHSYVRDSDIVFIIYDLTEKNAMASVTQGFRDIETCQPRVVAVVGNKTDLKPVPTHDVHSTIEPWLRQGWEIVTGTCSAWDAESTKKILMRCLNRVVCPRNGPIVIPAPIRLMHRQSQSQKCCT